MMIQLTFEIRSGGTVRETIDFDSVGYKLLNGYYPETNDSSEALTEAFDIMVSGTDTDLENNIRAVEHALAFAKKNPEGPDGVWVTFSPNIASLDAWQSRLKGGAVVHDARMGLRWKFSRVKAKVVIVRQPYWETVDAETLSLTNRAGTGATGAIVNHQDTGATDDFYVSIAEDAVEGGMAAPAIIEYKNTTNDGVIVDRLMVGHFAASAPYDPPAASSLVFEGAGQADANCSGGSYDDLSWADAVENQLVTWNVTSDDYLQRWYKMIARLRDVVAYTDLWLKLKLLSGSTVLAETRWALVTAGDALVVIGSLKIPPYKQGLYIDLGTLTLGLYEKRAAGAGVMNLDYVAALPMDSWRAYAAITGLAYNETLIDDPVNEMLYAASGAAYKVTHTIEEGEPVMLQPGVENVLYFLHDTTTGTSPIARTATVAVKYHPRRRTV